MFLKENNQANESIDKYKLLTAYGAPGSIIHTQYGSVLISSIEYWGFLKKIKNIIQYANNRNGIEDKDEYIRSSAKSEENGCISLSDDERLKTALKHRLQLENLKYLVTIPTIELNEYTNKILNDATSLAINSTFMPKYFASNGVYKTYNQWFKEWNTSSKFKDDFFPPKVNLTTEGSLTGIKNAKYKLLNQDNLLLICEHGHITSFPWQEFFAWRITETRINPQTTVDLFDKHAAWRVGEACNHTELYLRSNVRNASGFENKILSCKSCNKSVSLKGLMGLKVQCKAFTPWQDDIGELQHYSGNRNQPKSDKGSCSRKMRVALSTGNNIYYSRMLSSIFIPEELLKDDTQKQLDVLEERKEVALKENDFDKAKETHSEIEKLQRVKKESVNEDISEGEQDELYRFQEFNVFTETSEEDLNIEENLIVKDVTNNLTDDLTPYFYKVLRFDELKLTSAQLDFTRVQPYDGGSNPEVKPQRIYGITSNEVEVYPVVESFGEGIFFSFNTEAFESFKKNSSTYISSLEKRFSNLLETNSSFSKSAIEYGVKYGWQLYLVHTFSHLIMKELEFRCGYPTSSLSERIYVSNETERSMYGCLIYTSEGAEGSMGGLIAQTTKENIRKLIIGAMKRATVCNSDPLCWESEGQGLFDLNFSACFSCGLVSETSCELRNLYLDRRILVDEKYGFFKRICYGV